MPRELPGSQSPGGPPRGLRALQGLVIGLGLLIVLGTAVVIGVVIQRIYAPPPAASITRPAGPVAGSRLVLAPGEHIAGIAGAGGLVAVWVQSATGGRVVFIDPASGAATVALSTAAAPAR